MSEDLEQFLKELKEKSQRPGMEESSEDLGLHIMPAGYDESDQKLAENGVAEGLGKGRARGGRTFVFVILLSLLLLLWFWRRK